MPELPEIEVVKRSLFKMINKARIKDIKINNKNLRYKINSSFSEKLINNKILKVSRRSKYLIFHFNDKILLIHLGMSGKLLLKRISDKMLFKTSFYYDLNLLQKHNHIYFILDNGFVLIYNDIRRFGFFKVYEKVPFNKIKFLKKLGLEPFSKKLNSQYFKLFIKKRKKNIKNLLMDQTFISGLGNIYVNEILFKTKIHPTRACNNLNKKEIKGLVSNMRKILKLAIAKGGSSIRNFESTIGKSGNFQQFFHVYEQNGKKCSRRWCKGKIKKIQISNRSSFYCDNCQI
tara:strand:+ start:568 stop:1431 length:864 start_codon:yes stop_codon:yes gene_type:complete